MPLRNIPIFIISCNRLKTLKESIESYKKIGSNITFVIHDNNSTYPPLLDYLRTLENQGIKVYYHRKNVTRENQLNLVKNSIDDWFKHHTAPYYVVTDPDIALCDESEGILELYAHILDTMPHIEVVGPMLRIDDLPDFYPLKQKAIKKHFEQFWHKTPLKMQWNNKTIHYQHAPIDTTFGMYRKEFTFQRLCNGIRTYDPYWAQHLDWYIDPNNMSEDQIYYMQQASRVSHWGGAWLRETVAKKSRNNFLKNLLSRLR